MDMNDYKNECRACGKEAYTCAAVALLNSHLKGYCQDCIDLLWMTEVKLDALEIIEDWWFIQRKKMFRKPTKSAQKK